MIFDQIFDMINIGIIIIDKELKVYKWNRWMEIHSKIPAEKITGFPLFSFFPDLNNPRFLRNFKSVLTFGNFAFFFAEITSVPFPFSSREFAGIKF